MARAGKFRERAVFERRAAAGRDDYGNPAPAGWQPLGRIWADLRETPGREAIAAGRVEAKATGTLRVRASAVARSILAQDRVTVRGAVWVILSAPVWADQRGAVLEMTVERGGAVQ